MSSDKENIIFNVHDQIASKDETKKNLYKENVVFNANAQVASDDENKKITSPVRRASPTRSLRERSDINIFDISSIDYNENKRQQLRERVDGLPTHIESKSCIPRFDIRPPHHSGVLKASNNIPRPASNNSIRASSKPKHLPVKSSGYGRVLRSNSVSNLQQELKISKSLRRRESHSDDERSSGISRGKSSLYQSPTGKVIKHESNWGKQQYLSLKKRRIRSGLSTDKKIIEREVNAPKRKTISTPSTVNAPKRKPISTPSTRTRSKAKRVCDTSPASASSTCSYNGTHPVKESASKDGEKPLKTPSSSNKAISKLMFPSPLHSSQKSLRSYANIVATPNACRAFKHEIKNVALNMFQVGTGISNEEVKKILNSKATTGNRWELKKKLENANTSLKRTKDALKALLDGKNRFQEATIEIDKNTRGAWGRSLQKAREYEEEYTLQKVRNEQLERECTQLKAHSKDAEREIRLGQERIDTISIGITSHKEALASAEREYTQAKIALAIAEGRLEESSRQAEGWRAEIAKVEASKEEAIKQAQSTITATLEREQSYLRDECATLREKIESRELELGGLVNYTSKNGNRNSPLDEVKRELTKLREQVNDLRVQKIRCEAELTRAISDREAAVARAASKDRDMSELMKSLGNIQRSGQAREEEAKTLRKDAEEKALTLDHLLAKSRGELSVMMHEKATLTLALDDAKREINILVSSADILKKEILECKEGCSTYLANLQVEKELRARAEDKEQEERRERIAYSAQMMAMTKEHTNIEAHLKEANESLDRQWREKNDTQKEKFEKKDDELKHAKEIITGLEGERKSLIEELNEKKTLADAKSVGEIGRLNGEINVLKQRLIESGRRADDFDQANNENMRKLEAQLRDGHTERRRMHNMIQELRGNVRVFARVRPFLPGDGVDNDIEPSVVPKSDTSLRILNAEDPSNQHNFTFDRVFAPSAGQEAVFQEVSEFIQSALDGYNVCLFSYGQTGSGKTHTMQGSGVGQMRGIIARAIEQVGKYKSTLEGQGWTYKMKVSFLEIYNEKIRDLLRDGKDTDIKHEIKVDSEGHRFVSDLTMKLLEPTDLEAVENIMRQAAKHRTVASTEMNSMSSRSHSVFTLHLTALHSEQRKAVKGTLHLVDLAGSERLKRSGATGDRASETVAINKSLSSLTNVFLAIGKKSSHIPFRNSKLTHLLQPSLSGDGKTLMMINLSPTNESVQESLCTLRFASEVNKCELGKPKRSIQVMKGDESVHAKNLKEKRRKLVK